MSDALAACVGKQAFDTPQMARQVAKKRKVPAQHFRCQVCGKYHIGASDLRYRKKRKGSPAPSRQKEDA